MVTTVTLGRRAVFVRLPVARQAIAALRECDRRGFSSTLAYVLMPDHLHWLVQLHNGSLSALLQRFKSCSASQVNRLLRRTGKTLWQPGFHDRAVRDDEDIRAIARYIAANPIQAGLVRNIGQYPHWDAIWLE